MNKIIFLITDKKNILMFTAQTYVLAVCISFYQYIWGFPSLLLGRLLKLMLEALEL